MKIELRNIRKYFGPVRANDDITLTVEGGTIFGLLGENGAGKSTLMKVLSGYFAPTGGQIVLDGQAVELTSPSSAIHAGVGMLHQDPLDFPPMRIIENLVLGRNNRVNLGQQAAEAAFRDLCRQFDFDLDPDGFVSDLSVGERQQLEIVRLLWLGARALILDEPTTGISAPQKVKLFATLKQLAADGKSIIFVSHKLEDVEELCSQAAVLRQGKLVGQMDAPFDATGLIEMMFGQVLSVGNRPNVPLGNPAVRLNNATIADLRLEMSNVDLAIQAGEVIGLAGLEGSGQRLLMQACAGLMPLRSGTLQLDGIDVTNQPYHRFLDAQVAFMPADRMTEGLVPGLTLAEHYVLVEHRRNKRHQRTIDWRGARQASQADINEFNIKGTPDSTVESLSGGNQQRTLLSLLPNKLRLLIMEHPTRGLDVESAMYIWGKLLERRADGTAIIFSSADLDEVHQYSDRILICYNGQITAVLQTSDTSVDALGYWIAGTRPDAGA